MSLRPESFKVACYNVLAECWINPCKPIFLGCWESRKVELVNRMCHLNADFLCLQEVDRFDDLAHLLFQRGYTGYRVHDRDVAIFYKTDRFIVLKQETLHYSDHFHRSALMLKLQSVDGGIPFNLISTHVTWLNGYDLQEMEELRKFVLDHQEDPVIVCGDLNATPDSEVLQKFPIKNFHDTLSKSSKKTYIDQHRRLDYIFVPKGVHVKAANVDGNPAELSTKIVPAIAYSALKGAFLPLRDRKKQW
jgi:endonuclease/exonuclease/phosphatase family metal-dependent hydrolase